MSQQINLFNPIFLKQKKYFSVVAMLQALLLIVIGATLFYAFAWYQVRQLSVQTQELISRYEAEQRRIANYENEFSLQRMERQLQEELQAVEAQVAAQQKVLDTLKRGAIGNTQGYSEFFRAFARQIVPGLWLTGLAIDGDGSKISLHGGVVDPQLLASYIQRLNRESVMRGKFFASLKMQQPVLPETQSVAPYVEFTLQSEKEGMAK